MRSASTVPFSPRGESTWHALQRGKGLVVSRTSPRYYSVISSRFLSRLVVNIKSMAEICITDGQPSEHSSLGSSILTFDKTNLDPAHPNKTQDKAATQQLYLHLGQDMYLTLCCAAGTAETGQWPRRAAIHLHTLGYLTSALPPGPDSPPNPDLI